MSTAQDAVFSTPELLERILAFLPMPNLLVTAPLISKTWQATTLTPLLQRILFFQPDPTPASKPVQNPLLAALFPPFFAQTPDQNRWAWPSAGSIKKLPWAAAPEAFRRSDASWRRMLVQQPPVRSMFVVEMYHAQGGSFEHRAELSDLELRMGALYDLALPLIDREASSFRIRWHGTVGADLTLDVIFTVQCSDESESLIDEQFYTEGTSNTLNDERSTIQFGKFVPMRRPL
ncbi:hypothetical protein C8R47DRAFT_1086617 [Mycena vitilis]|nr:hypothetical protein C8R47DRAFT_1086617 [Mycena vitilis]